MNSIVRSILSLNNGKELPSSDKESSNEQDSDEQDDSDELVYGNQLHVNDEQQVNLVMIDLSKYKTGLFGIKEKLTKEDRKRLCGNLNCKQVNLKFDQYVTMSVPFVEIEKKHRHRTNDEEQLCFVQLCKQCEPKLNRCKQVEFDLVNNKLDKKTKRKRKSTEKKLKKRNKKKRRRRQN